MSDFQAVSQEVISNFEYSNPEPPPPVVLTSEDLPPGMPLTNGLDKMTTEQARFAIQNGDAWLEYLKANDGEFIESESSIEIAGSDADKKSSILKTLARMEQKVKFPSGRIKVGMDKSWREILEWALSVMPACYESTRQIISEELSNVGS